MAKFAKHIVSAAAFICLGQICFAAMPTWASKAVSRRANIVKTDAENALVLLDKGSSSNYRIGAFCDVKKNDKVLLTAVVIECAKNSSVALLLGDYNVAGNETFELRLINK